MNAEGHTGPADRDVVSEQTIELSVVARKAGVKIVHVRRYLEFGLFQPHAAAADAQLLEETTAARVARAERLRNDLGLNYAGAVLACELLDRIGELEARLRR
jgi:MerR HTH family regulatory protein